MMWKREAWRIPCCLCGLARLRGCCCIFLSKGVASRWTAGRMERWLRLAACCAGRAGALRSAAVQAFCVLWHFEMFHVLFTPACLSVEGTLSIPVFMCCCPCRYCNTYPLCLNLLSSKRVNVQPLITHRYTFDGPGVADGFAMASQPNAVKVMFNL